MIRRKVFRLRRGLLAVGFRFPSLVDRQATLPIGFAGLALG